MIENNEKNRRFFSDIGGVLVKCTDCKHRTGSTTCKAFPNGIPFAEIVNKIGECQNGIEYETVNTITCTEKA